MNRIAASTKNRIDRPVPRNPDRKGVEAAQRSQPWHAQQRAPVEHPRPRTETVAECMPRSVVESSRGRDWHGVEVMLARIADDGLDVDRLPAHTVAINVGRPYRLEGSVDGRNCGGQMMSGTIKIVPAGPSSRWHWRGGDPIEMLHLSVSAAELRMHVRELDVRGEPEILTRVGIEDAPLLEIARGFASELAARTAGSLAADALRTELVLRLLADHSSLAGSGAIRFPSHRLGTRILRQLDEYIDAHLGADFGIADLAALAGVSRFHFARAFKATTGAKPYRYVVDRRIERARAFLRRSRLSIAEIAAATGFADQSHLTRNFKERYGVTPRAYRAYSTNLLDGAHFPVIRSD